MSVPSSNLPTVVPYPLKENEPLLNQLVSEFKFVDPGSLHKYVAQMSTLGLNPVVVVLTTSEYLSLI